GLRLSPHTFIVAVIHLRYSLHIGGNRLRLVKAVPTVADGWIQQQGQPYKKGEKKEQGISFVFLGSSILHTGLSLPLRCREGALPGPQTASQRSLFFFIFCSHTSFYNQQHSCTDDQHAAQHIEKGGAHATGFWQLCSFV